jgi:hypothetical protein
MKDLPGIIGILVICIEIYRWMWGRWIRYALEAKKRAKQPRKPAVMRLKSELVCQHCVEEKGKKSNPEQKKAVVAWSERKGRGERRKSFSTEGYLCSNKGCEYYGVRDERIHALAQLYQKHPHILVKQPSDG